VVFALSPIHLKDYLAFLDQQEPSVLDNPRFKELEPLVPKNANSVAYTDTGDQFATMYRFLGPMLTLAQGIPGVPIAIDLANLPSVRTVRRHLFDSISYGYATDDLIVDECRSPFGFGFMGPAPAMFFLAMGAGMALPLWARARMDVDVAVVDPVPAVMEERVAPQMEADLGNLKQIHGATLAYEAKHGAYPASLSDLLDKLVAPGKNPLVLPGDPNPPKLGNGPPCSYGSAFDRHPNRVFTKDFPGRYIMVWDRQGFFDGNRNAVYFDGHIEELDAQRFQRALKEVDQDAGRLKERKPAAEF
jgi:hypothetical protein